MRLAQTVRIFGPLRVADRGDRVEDDEGEDLISAPKLVDNFGYTLEFAYKAEVGGLLRRRVTIDGVYGYLLDHPRYIRGLDRDINEMRTFRVDRMDRIYSLDGQATQDNLGWLIGQLVRAVSGLPLTRAPFRVTVGRSACVDRQFTDGRTQSLSVDVDSGEFRYVDDGPSAVLLGIGSSAGRPRRQVRLSLGPYADSGIVSLTDGPSGEPAASVIGWLLEHGEQVWD